MIERLLYDGRSFNAGTGLDVLKTSFVKINSFNFFCCFCDAMFNQNCLVGKDKNHLGVLIDNWGLPNKPSPTQRGRVSLHIQMQMKRR